MKKLLLSKLKLSSDELIRTSWLFLLFFLLMNGILFGRNARDSIFLAKVGLPSLPYAYMLNAVLAILSSFVYAMFVDRIDRSKLVKIILCLFIGVLVMMFVVLKAEMVWFYWATYSLVQVMWLMSLMVFWTYAADFFDAVQSKRVFPLIGMGGLVGMITSGFIIKPLVKALGTEKLFLAWGALLGVAFVIVSVLTQYRPATAKSRLASTAPKPQKQGQWEQLMEGFRNVRRTPLLGNMVVMILALWLVFTLVDYQFSQVCRDNFSIKDAVTGQALVDAATGMPKVDKNALTTFLGIFRSWAGVCCLVVQIFLTPLLIRKLGVAWTMMIHPGFLVFSIGGMAAAFGFVPACITKFGDHVLLYTATDVAYQLLFNPIPSASRGRARAFVEGYVKPFSMGVAGLVLLLLLFFKLEPHQIAQFSLALTVVWFVAALVLKKNYLKAVVDNLHMASRAGEPQLKEYLSDNTAELTRLYEKRLTSANVDDVQFAIEYFILLKYEPAARLCLPLLQHPNIQVRRKACQAMAEIGGSDILGGLESALQDPDNEVVRYALAGIRRIGTEEQLPVLDALYHHPELSVAAAAVETAAEVGGFDGILATAELLKRWSKSEDPREQEVLAIVLGRLKIKSFMPVLLDLARRPNPGVARRAILALTSFRDDRALAPLADAMLDDLLFPRIQRYFSGLGGKFRGSLTGLYRKHTRSVVRHRLLKAIAHSSKWDPTTFLIEEARSADPVVRFLCIKYLAERENVSMPPDLAVDVLTNEIEHWLQIETLREHLLSQCTPRARDVVNLVFTEEIHRTRKTVFLALGFIHDHSTIRRIYRNAFHGEPTERALALEALENLNLRPWTSILLPLLSDRNLVEARTQFLHQRAGAKFDVDSIVQGMLALSYSYVLASILYVWKENRETSHLPLVNSLRDHHSAIVREHAVAAASALQGG